MKSVAAVNPGFYTTVLQALSTQGRVINALVLRETKTRYGEHKLGFVWAFIEPTIMVSIFVAFFAILQADSQGAMPLVTFMITGILPFTMFREVMVQMQGAIAQNRTLLGFPQVTTFDVIVARGVLEFSILSLVFAFMLFMAHLLGYRVEVEDPLKLLWVCILMALFGTGIGFFFASITPLIPSVRQITTVALGRPLFLSSGLFYTAESLPGFIRDWLLYNPLLHMVEFVRSAFYYEFESNYASWNYVYIWVICSLALGMTTHQAMRRRAIVGL